MRNWNLSKTFILGIISGVILYFAGFSLKTTVIVAFAFAIFVSWIADEINFTRNAHGSNLESKIEELRERVDKLEKKDKRKK